MSTKRQRQDALLLDVDLDDDPFGPDEPLPAPKRSGALRPTAKPGTEEHRKQLLDYAMSGHTDLDSYAASRATQAGKGRRKRPNFLPYAKAFYAAKGLTFERKETQVWLRGCDFPMSMDHLGLFDGVCPLPGGAELGVQVCSKEGVTAHIRKMLSEKRCMAGNRRKNLLQWWADGNRSVICFFDQPGGRGTKWIGQEREVTKRDLDRLLEGKKISLSGVY